jgi:very-short-patch-repair endonuclease
MPKKTIDHAVDTGRLYPVFRGAYAVGHPQSGTQDSPQANSSVPVAHRHPTIYDRPPLGTHTRLVAAALACGEGSVVSHGTAGALLGIWSRPPAEINVIAPVQAGRKIPGIFRRHVPAPLGRDAFVHEGVPCTTPSRTVVDSAGVLREWDLRRVVEQAAVRGVLHLPTIDAILAGPRRRGSPALRRILEPWRAIPAGTRFRSPPEARLLTMIAERGLPLPRCNERLTIAGYPIEADFHWPDHRLVIEVDSRTYHGNPIALERDHRRDLDLTVAGYRVVRFTRSQIENEPEATLMQIGQLLRR